MTEPTDANAALMKAAVKRSHDQYKLATSRAAFQAGAIFGSAFHTTQPTQAQAVAVPLTCEWTHNDDDGFWETACGDAWRFDDGGPKENNMNFCHCCGKPLRIKGGQHGAE